MSRGSSETSFVAEPAVNLKAELKIADTTTNKIANWTLSFKSNDIREGNFIEIVYENAGSSFMLT